MSSLYRGKRAEAERRRALALKALDQRLNAAAVSRSASAPTASSESAETGVTAGGDESRAKEGTQA